MVYESPEDYQPPKPKELAFSPEGLPILKEDTGPRFDHLLYEMLEKKDGIFIGERHNLPSLRQSLEKLAPALKARGVTTLSIEVRPVDIDAIMKAKSLEEYLKTPGRGIPNDYRPDEIYHLVKAYDKAGRVLSKDR